MKAVEVVHQLKKEVVEYKEKGKVMLSLLSLRDLILGKKRDKRTLAVCSPLFGWTELMSWKSERNCFKQQFAYLAVLMDLFTRSIRGWQLVGNLREDLPKAAFNERWSLVGQRSIIRIRWAYAATDYVAFYKGQGVQAQMSVVAQDMPTENGYTERLMHTL